MSLYFFGWSYHSHCSILLLHVLMILYGCYRYIQGSYDFQEILFTKSDGWVDLEVWASIGLANGQGEKKAATLLVRVLVRCWLFWLIVYLLYGSGGFLHLPILAI